MKPHGFTLIELCITLVVFGILLAVAMPSMSEIISGSRIKSAQETVLGTIVQAKSEAVKTNSTLTVAIAPPTITVLNGTAVLKTVTIAGASMLSITASTFAFNSLGAESTATNRTIDIIPASGSCSNEVPCSKIQIFGGGLVKACNPAQGDVNATNHCL
ncbi:MAG: prepilin-type N-terminal cleavage/methylation domain-containing protein [Nitrosospira sp.]|nr:prepilin-type N-terminal cleavage/methylation domain-containing protein [Nitrosospira sp.]